MRRRRFIGAAWVAANAVPGPVHPSVVSAGDPRRGSGTGVASIIHGIEPPTMDPKNLDLSRRTTHRRRLGALALLIVVAVIVAASARLHNLSEEAVTALGSLIALHPGWGALAFIGLAAVSAMMAFVTSVVLVPVAVHHWGPVMTALLLWIGWLVGGWGAYAIGRYLGGPAVRRLVGTTRAKYYEEQITARAPFLVVVLFQIALQSEIPAYVMGMARYPLPRYLLALGVAELPFAIGAVLLGSGFLNRQYWLMVVVGLVGIAVVSLAVGGLHRRLSKGRERPPESPSPA